MINMRLAKERGLSDKEIEQIEYLHGKLELCLEYACVSGYDEDLYKDVEYIEYLLQDLWGFPQDAEKHQWKHRYKFKSQWAGRTFRCNITGEEFTIPNSVEEGDYFSFGKSSIDVGRLGSYSRVIGKVVEITEEGNEDQS